MYDYLIVGSGLYGAVFAYAAKQQGKRILVIEKRSHTGGNIYCEPVEGINVHKYGAHIFHTSDKKVWKFVNSFVEFNRFTNSLVAVFHDRLYNLPFNMNTFYALWGCKTPREAAQIIDRQRKEADIEKFGRTGNRIGRSDIYRILIKEYTEKQWGRKCSQLPPFIIKRLPVRFTFDNNYFDDLYQGIPSGGGGGYNLLIGKLLDGIEVRTSTDFFENRSYWNSVSKKIIFTGKIDEYFDYRYGRLEYRTVRFETEKLPEVSFQGNAVVNYTSADVPFTRIIEHKHFEPENTAFFNPVTVISREYSSEWNDGSEPFYPINDEKNNALYRKYKALVDREEKTVFGGRLAEYKYYDMDDVIKRSLEDGERDIFNSF